MRNPNRLVGVALILFLSLGGLWWLKQENRVQQVAPVAVLAPTPIVPVSPSIAASQVAPVLKPSSAKRSAAGAAANPVAEFRSWAERYVSGTPEARASLMAEGLRLAEIRKPMFEQLIKSNPRQAIDQALPYNLRHALPAAFDGSVERVVSGNGNLDVFGAVPFPGRSSLAEPIRRIVEVNGERFRGYTYGARQHETTQRGTPLWGVALGDVVAVSENPGRVVSADEAVDLKAKGSKISDPVCGVSGLAFQPGQQPLLFQLGSRLSGLCSAAHASILNGQFHALLSASTLGSGVGGSNPTNLEPTRALWVTQGKFNVLFMRVVFQDDPIEPISVDELTSIMNEVNEYYRTASWNQVHMIPTITPVLMLPNSKPYYSFLGGEGQLLADARRVAADAGYNVSDFDLDLVGLSPVPGFDWGGLAAVGGRAAWIQAFTPKVITHELGHNLGLLHANSLNTTRPPLPPLDPPHPFDLGSLFGHQSISSAGRYLDDAASTNAFDVEYGDPNDWMGNGDNRLQQFNSLHKVRLKWMSPDHIAQPTQSATNRLYAFDAPTIESGRSYAIAVGKEYGRSGKNRSYWIDHRQLFPDNPWMANGVLVYWTPWEGTKGSAQLLDMNGESPNGMRDAALTLGRTFSDWEANVHITPVLKGVESGTEWIDVVTQIGPFPGNTAPSFDLVASSLFVSPGSSVRFTADNVVDGDGDPVAYYWTLSDGTFGPNSSVMVRTFPTPGHYLVRCEVSDMKGGKLSRHVVVTVGAPADVTVTGFVRDENGQPVADARVLVIGSGNNRYTFTDSDGSYAIVGLQSGVVTNVAFRYGYDSTPLNFVNPSPIFDTTGGSFDHVAVSFPKVSVQAFGSADESRGSPDAKFQFRRQGGDLSTDLAVFIQLGGTATIDKDYKLASNSVIYFPTGVDTVDLPFSVLDDTEAEGKEYASVQLVLSTNLERYINYVTNMVLTNVDAGVTNVTTNTLVLIQTNTFPVPGWELRTIDGVLTWYQTHPIYVLGNETASISISDNEAGGNSTVQLFPYDETALEGGEDEAIVLMVRSGNPDQALDVKFSPSGVASNGVDYYQLPATMHFEPGQTVVPIYIRAKDDLFVEGDETVTLTLVPGLGYSVKGDPVTVIIVDNDLPSVTVTTTKSQGMESDAVAASFTLTRVGNLGAPLDVNYLLGGTATNGGDYQLMSGTATILAGEDSVVVNIQPIRDDIIEAPETIELQISASTYYNVGAPSVGKATLYDASTPKVSMTSSNLATLTEGVGAGAGGSITITRTGPTTSPLTVNLAFAGSADRFSDYSAIGNQVTIPAGSSSITIPLSAADDPFPEIVESIEISLLPGDGYLVSFGSVNIVLNDNDSSPLPSVEFVTSAISLPENFITGGAPTLPSGQYQIPIRFSKITSDTPLPIVIEYRVVGGTATVGLDFSLTNGVTNGPLVSRGFLVFTNFPGYPSEKTNFCFIPINIIDDTNVEPNETFTIGLFYPSSFVFTNVTEVKPDMGPSIMVTNFVVAPTNFTLGPVRFHTVTILDNDGATVSVTTGPNPAREEGQVPAQFIFHRTGPTDKAITAEFGVTGTASPNTDYVPLPRAVTFPVGVDTVTLDVIPIDDSTPEIAESVRVTLSRVIGGQLDPTSMTATILIIDNDGTMEFQQPDFTIAESVGTFKVPVQRYGITNLTQSVDYVITGGTATPGLDYVAPATGTLVFLPGETLKTISLVISNDTLVEADETIQIALTNASGGTVLSGQSVTTVIIQSDDTEFRFSTNNFAWSERTNNAPITIQRVGPSQGVASVTLVVTNGTATNGLDFRGTNRVINFADGTSNVTFSVRILDDFLVEGNETVSLYLTNATPGIQLGAGATSVLTILDDDCVIEFATNTIRVNEFAGEVAIDVLRRGGVLNTVSVDFRTIDGTATGNVDFFRTNGTLTFLSNRNVTDTNGSGAIVFLPGVSNVTLRIPIFDDQIGEGEETFNVRLSNAKVPGGSAVAGSVTLGSQTNLLVAIRDDETAGSVDYPVASNIEISGNVNSVSLQPDGRLAFGGDFTEVNGFALRKIARLLPNGDLDTSFNPGVGAEGQVLSVVSQPNGRILIGGLFTDVDGIPRANLARINQAGDLDTSFDVGTGASGTIRAIGLQPDGKVVVGGEFLRFGAVNRTRLARAHADGRLDTNFTAVVNATVHAVVVQEDGKILIGGEFTHVNTLDVRGIVRLNSDGTIDNTFKVGAGVPGIVYAIATQTNGGVIVGGSFATPGGAAGQQNLLRLNPDGSLDATFAAAGGPNAAVLSLGVHSASGKIYAAGAFTSIGGLSRNRIARLRSNGSVDEGFDPGTGANATVRSLAVHPNSEVSIGGDFTRVNGIPRGHLARLHGDDRLSVVGVEFTAASYSVLENSKKVTVTLQRTGDPKVAFTVTASTTELGSTATAGLDYAPTNVLLTFGAGVKSLSFDLQIIDDTLIEPTETVNLTLNNASPGVDLSGVATSRVDILDDEVSLQLGQASYSANENDGAIVITVLRQGLTNSTASVRLISQEGSAIAGSDFVAVNLPLTFAAGEVLKSVDVSLINDFVREGDETFTLSLVDPSEGVQLGLSSSTVTIHDTDAERIEVIATALVSDPNHNGGIDSGEVVTLMVALKNTGTADAKNVSATVVPSPGVVLEAGDPQLQQFGALLVNGAPASRPFTFGNTASLGSVINLTLQLSDGDRDLGLLLVPVPLGAQSKTFTSGTGININDASVANPYPSVLNVAGLPGTITKLTLTLDGFSHPFPADVDMLLVGPNGSSSVIFSDLGGNNGVDNLVITLDDSALTDPPILVPLTSGTFRPKNNKVDDNFPAPAPAGPYRNGTLDFKGIDPNGAWSLYIVDDRVQGVGALHNGWRLSIATSGLLLPSSDAGVEILADPASAVAGQNLKYHVRVFNNGPANAENVVVTQVLPNDAAFVSATGGATHPNNTLQWTVGTLGAGAEQVFDVIVTPSGGAALQTQVSLSQSNKDIFAGNNIATLVTTVSAGQPVSLTIELVGKQVRISWPKSAGDVSLEATSDLAGKIWTAVLANVSVNGNRKEVLLTPDAGTRFYRLRQP